MSHFSVLVIGEDVEGQLAAYDENIQVEPYVNNPDAHDDLVGALEFLVKPPSQEERERAGYEETVDTKQLREKYADRTVDSLSDAEKLEVMAWYSDSESRYKIEDGKLVEYTTYNELSKWDWYEIGGRWRGFFKLKPTGAGLLTPPHWSEKFNDQTPEDKTGWADQARKGDIDFDGMRAHAEAEARERWAELEKATAGIAPPTEGWKQVLDRHGVDNIDAARAEYNNHPWVQATRQLAFLDDPFVAFRMDEPDPKAAYVAGRKATAVQTYAMVHEGQWIAKGEMGWFGMSDDKLTAEQFAVKQWELIESLPDDVLLTLVDCHI